MNEPAWAARFATAAVAFGLLAFSVAGHCQIYVSSAVPDSAESAGNTLVLSNFRSEATPVLLLGQGQRKIIEATKVNARSASRSCAARRQFSELIDGVSRRVDISPDLLHAVILAESNYDAAAVSRRGAIGLMQLMPTTAARFGVANPFIVKDNIFAGASYLKWLVGYFGEDLELVLAAYNAGEQAVMKAGRKIPPYPETQAYVRRIMGELNAAAGPAAVNACEGFAERS
ncbi:hypothetical protein BH11PSE8_BH11PSE8_40030 [soil metagenome]